MEERYGGAGLFSAHSVMGHILAAVSLTNGRAVKALSKVVKPVVMDSPCLPDKFSCQSVCDGDSSAL